MREEANGRKRTVNDELLAYVQDFRTISREALALIDRLTENQWRWRQESGRWSIGECLEHLTITGELLVPKLEEAIRLGREKGLLARGPFSYSWPGRMFVDSQQPGARPSMRTLKIYQPTGRTEKTVCLRRFVGLQDRLIRAAESAEGLDLLRIKVASPAGRLVRFSLGVWFAATIAHEHRHLEQALRVSRDPRFPIS